jgi:hypothetical protein
VQIRIDLEQPKVIEFALVDSNNICYQSIHTSLCLVRRGIPSLKHSSWISCMQARAGEVNEGGAISDIFMINTHLVKNVFVLRDHERK